MRNCKKFLPSKVPSKYTYCALHGSTFVHTDVPSYMCTRSVGPTLALRVCTRRMATTYGNRYFRTIEYSMIIRQPFLFSESFFVFFSRKSSLGIRRGVSVFCLPRKSIYLLVKVASDCCAKFQIHPRRDSAWGGEDEWGIKK